MRNFQGIIHEHNKPIGRFSNLHQCTFKDFDFYLDKSYLHKMFILGSDNETTQKNYFEKFIEELDFLKLSTQAKHLGVWILHDDGLNDSPRYYHQFLHFQFTKV